jgi:hypothetical protein
MDGYPMVPAYPRTDTTGLTGCAETSPGSWTDLATADAQELEAAIGLAAKHGLGPLRFPHHRPPPAARGLKTLRRRARCSQLPHRFEASNSRCLQLVV